jgi:hypothetical protein
LCITRARKDGQTNTHEDGTSFEWLVKLLLPLMMVINTQPIHNGALITKIL